MHIHKFYEAGVPTCRKWQSVVTMLFFGIKIPTTKHEIMLHAMSLKGGPRTSTNCVHVSWQLGTNWISWYDSQAVAHTSSCVCQSERRTLWTQTEPIVQNVVVAYNSIVYQTFLINFINFCLFVQMLYNKNQWPHRVVWLTVLLQWCSVIGEGCSSGSDDVNSCREEEVAVGAGTRSEFIYGSNVCICVCLAVDVSLSVSLLVEDISLGHNIYIL